MSGPVLVSVVKRARNDKLATLLAASGAAGVRFRIAGAHLQVAGTSKLHPQDRALLHAHQGGCWPG